MAVANKELFSSYPRKVLAEGIFQATLKRYYSKYIEMADTAYCVKCKAKRDMTGASKVTMKNGRSAMRGTCSKCGTKMFSILGKAKK